MDASKVTDDRSYLRKIRMRFDQLTQAITDARDAIRLRPTVGSKGFVDAAEKNLCALRPHYEEYTTTVSQYDYTVSLELSVFLMTLCSMCKPRRILDLGSGFSSFVFRSYGKDAVPAPVVYSIDDSPDWLEKTRAFLTRNALDLSNLMDWQTFDAQELPAFDLILHDLDGLKTRKETLVRVLKRSSPAGYIILDDMHLYDYAVFAKRTLARSRLTYYSLNRFTRDRGGRYSYLVKFLTRDKAR